MPLIFCTFSHTIIGNITAFTASGRDGKAHRHVLRLYDVNRSDWRAIGQIGIPASKTNTNGEVIEAHWSPDGIHLACARDDNTIDVFDTRWLGQKQCMLVFKHDTDSSLSEGENAELYGVQGIAWFGSERLVSGGADHCVRVWDTRKDEECRVLATLGGAVGYLVGSEDPGMFPIVA
jgi:WD40 repeat protein